MLDVGCAPGTFARHIADAGCSVTGIDASRALLDAALRADRGRPRPVEYIHADATDRDLLAGRTYDRVLAKMSISDIDALDAALANAARLLDHGIFVLSLLH